MSNPQAAPTEALYAKGYNRKTTTDPDGVTTHRSFEFNGSRYHYDRTLCPAGFSQYDTDEDAWYFGVWVHINARIIVTYAEGDVTEEHCGTEANLLKRLASMREFYGAPPRVARVVEQDGTVVDIFTGRPGDELLQAAGLLPTPSEGKQ